MDNTQDRGGVRELSYDPDNARPRGQTELQIIAEAAAETVRPTHVPRPDRFYLLRFLGLGEFS